ncbi:hypothetical protein HYZ05_00985 [Candidatus Daviesbacteria bacterium]|nr:hypothetical protein [Candidatus Daviesbacteria bacterium]
MAERLSMAEATSGPGPEATPPVGEGQAVPQSSGELSPQRPWHISKEFDPKRTDYTSREEGNWNIFVDPKTNKEVARAIKMSGGADKEDGEYYDGSQEKPKEWWPFTEDEWKNLDIKDRIVEAAVLAMRHYYDMDNVDRAAKEKEFSMAYQDFSEYALGKKLYDGKDTRVIALELELVSFDKTEIEKYKADPEKQGQIEEALNNLDALEHEQAGIQNAWKDYGITDQNKNDDQLRPPHVAQDEWKKYLEGKDEIKTRLEAAKQALVALTSQEFFNKREKIKIEVGDKVKELKEEMEKKEKEAKKEGVRVDAEQWEIDAYKLEKELERSLLQGTEVSSDPDKSDADVPVEEILRFIKEEGEKPVAEQYTTGLERAKKVLEWNFHEARKLGILEDLEERFEERYKELATAVFSKSRTDQGDTEIETRRGPRNLTIAEIKETLAREADERNPNSLSNTAESDTFWKYLVRDGLVPGDRVNHFKGIRKAFVDGTYDQIYDSLSNLYNRYRADELRGKLQQQLDRDVITQQQYDRRINEINNPRNIQRISGEWDVRKYERDIMAGLDNEERAEAGRLFYIDRYYLTLTGTTEAQIEQGVNNYLTSILEGAHVYDVQTIMQKMQYLSQAIMSKKDVLMQSGMSATDAQAALTRINILAENRGEFYVMNFSAQNLLMDEYFIPLYDKWGGVKGIEKLKESLDMNDGLIAPCMLLFLDKKNRLLFQPAGFKGQGMKNIWAQRTLRDKIKGQIAEELVNFQAKKANSTELMEQATWQDFLRMKFEKRWDKKDEQDNKIFFKPKEETDAAKKAYQAEYMRVKTAAKPEDLESLKRLREEYTKQKNRYDRLLDRAKSAVETTWQVFNIFGESARLGAPSIIMRNGDHISIEDATYFYKFVLLDAMKKSGDTPAMMRWRAYQWVKNHRQSEKNPVIKDGVTTYELVAGLEDTGITKGEYDEFLKAVKELRLNGYKAAFREYSFEEIISRNDVRPVRNNFISNYKSSREIFANPTAMREAKKGRQPFIKNILERLDRSGRGQFTALDRAKIDGKPLDGKPLDGKPLDKVPDERLKEIFEDAITDSFVFHITARQLALWEATLESSVDAQDNIVYTDKFSTGRIYYGSQDIPWGVKRLQYLPEYWMTNKRERIGRAWKLLPFVPLLKSGLAQECDAENLPDLILNVNKEHIDEPGLKQIAAGYKDAQGWRQRGETSVDEQRGETNWAWWDKLTVDAAQILKTLPQLDFPPQSKNDATKLGIFDYIIDVPNPEEFMKNHPIPFASRKVLVDTAREILKREAPLNVFLEAQLGYNRSAGGSGIGLEMGERWHYRILNWWLSEVPGDIDNKRGTEGGLEVNSDAAIFLKFITIKNSWSAGVSILDEAWRQARGTRDAGASDKLPQEIIT